MGNDDGSSGVYAQGGLVRRRAEGSSEEGETLRKNFPEYRRLDPRVAEAEAFISKNLTQKTDPDRPDRTIPNKPRDYPSRAGQELLDFLEKTDRTPAIVESRRYPGGSYEGPSFQYMRFNDEDTGVVRFPGFKKDPYGSLVHELTHAADRAMQRGQGTLSKKVDKGEEISAEDQKFLDGYKKLYKQSTKLPLDMPDKSVSDREKKYRTSDRELRAFGAGNMAQDSPEAGRYNSEDFGETLNSHVDATMAQEAAIMRDLFLRSDVRKRAEGSSSSGEYADPEAALVEQAAMDQAPRPTGQSAADSLKQLGLSVARGVPQLATGMVDLAAMPFTMSGMVSPEQVMGSTEYLPKRGFLPPAQKGAANETAELLSSALSPAAATKGLAAAALGAMTRAAPMARQLALPLEKAAETASPMVRAYTGHTRELVGPYDVSRSSKMSDMGPGLYLTEDSKYASRSAEKRLGKTVPESEAAPAVYPVDIAKQKILMHDVEYPRAVLDKLRAFSRKVADLPGKKTVSGEYIYEQLREAAIPKTMLPSVFKMMGFNGAEFLPGGVTSKGRSFVVYDTADTAKGAYTGKKFSEGGEATVQFIKKSSKRR